jgi:hypothetical protein
MCENQQLQDGSRTGVGRQLWWEQLQEDFTEVAKCEILLHDEHNCNLRVRCEKQERNMLRRTLNHWGLAMNVQPLQKKWLAEN